MSSKKVLFFLITFFVPLFSKNYDLTVVGLANKADGIGRISLGIIDTLKDELQVNYIPCGASPNLTDVGEDVQAILENPDQTPGTVSILTNALWHESRPYYQVMPKSKLKFAYSMIESTKIPVEWVEILNNQFDGVVVPDKFLIEVYQDSGVTIPIFEIAHGMELEEFLASPPHPLSKTPFVFGSTVSFDPRKNHELLLKAFAKEFQNSRNVVLRMNGRFGDREYLKLKDMLRTLKISNVIITKRVLKNENYLSFMKTFDCYVNIAKGEGFSLCPREALALGIPCVLTNNTAQKTLCESGYVRVVPSKIVEPAIYSLFGKQDMGFFFNCEEKDVRAALRDVYTNYAKHLQMAWDAREWVKQYCWKNLKGKYLNLVKPKILILGEANEITDEYFMTNSPKLFEKYIENGLYEDFYIELHEEEGELLEKDA